MNAALPMDVLDKELAAIENEIVPLTKQTPYTLLMMRVVEIGLPLLLSLFSIFFLLRYSLTEKRCHEIKELAQDKEIWRVKRGPCTPVNAAQLHLHTPLKLSQSF